MKRNKIQAFTLIEVLIALVILAISLTALVKASSSNTENLIYIRDKSIAHWVGMNTISQVQLGLIKAGFEPFYYEEKVTNFNKPWVVRSSLEKTTIPNMLLITVKVSTTGQKQPLVILNGYKKATT